MANELQSGLTPTRQSPFRRQQSTNTAPAPRATTPNTSPTKSSLLSPARGGSISMQDEDSPLDQTRRARSPSPTKQESSYSITRPNQMESPSAGRQTHNTYSRVTNGLDGQRDAETQSATNMRQPVFTNPSSNISSSTLPTPTTSRGPNLPKSNGAYNNIPAPLLRSFRESFEVLDPNARGTLDTTSLLPMLEQLGLASDSKALAQFFPSAKSQNMNLATYLDMLSGPHSQLSSPDELAAAFGAFDVDDSGQIDVAELREAVLKTMPEPGEANPGARLTEPEIDSILQDFIGRRAFGPKGLGAGKRSVNPKSDVFRWREFVGSFGGGAQENEQAVAV